MIKFRIKPKTDSTTWFIIGALILNIVFIMAFWGAVIWVAWHFIKKLW